MKLQVADDNQLELVVSNPGASPFQDLLNSQKDLFRGQIDALENIVLTQCRLTGVNPLSQEMCRLQAAGALSIPIGKRPRDLLNPKAVKYMQSVFSVKDAITKKETREISALYAVTATQVRDFFATQRSRVRKFVRLSQEKANRSSSSKEMHDGAPLSSDYNDPLTPVPLDSVAPITAEQGPTCLTQDEVLPTEDQSDKYFIDNILSLMRKEESFSGQVKLMKWIMQIQNASVLYWFLTNGGVMILATWLTQALFEEQTSVLRVILKVLCHLPLQKALPVHMPAILQSVNSLRFYRVSDISNRARILLTRWTKTFASSQALRKTNGTKSASDSQDEILLKKSISEVMGNESWHANMDNLEDNSYAMDESPDIIRKLESQPLKLLTAFADDPNKKLIRGALSSQNRERRKVLLVEQPGQKSTGRTSQIARSTATKGRPLSADDIQKAKIRAQFMQSKYHKTNATSDTSPQMQPEGASKSASSQISTLAAAPKMRLRDEIEEPRKCGDLPLEVANQQSTSDDNKINPKSDESPSKKCVRFQIQWQTPPEIHINVSWSVGGGEHSKEVEIQKNRIHRERETVYKTLTEIPSNPKEPWDREIDYDDTLTPEIPFEQLPDVESAQVSVSARRYEGTAGADTFGAKNAAVMPEPDLDLLAALLKNPELVFALTSGQAGNMSNEGTVKLLDTIRANEINTLASIGASSGKGKLDDKVEVSLPSPTPSMDAVTSAWKRDYAKNPFSQQKSMVKHEAQSSSAVASHEKIPAISIVQPGAPPSISTLPKMEQQLIASALRSEEKFRAGGSVVQPRMQPAGVGGSQGSETLEQLAQRLPQVYGLHEQGLPAIASSPHHNFPVYTANGNAQRPPASEFLLNTNHAASVSRLPQITNSHCAVVAPALHIDNMGVVSPSILMLTSSTLRSQTQLQSSYTLPEGHSWMPRQGLDPSRSVYQSTVNRNEYHTFVGAPVRGSMALGSWEKNDMMMDEQDFESWSPDNSPMRSRNRYTPGWSCSQEPRVSQPHRGYRPERSIPRHSSGYPSTSGYQEHGMNESKRWRDRR